MSALLLLVIACTPPRAASDPSAHARSAGPPGEAGAARAEGLTVEGPGWALAAVSADLAAGVARAAEPALRVEAAAGTPALEVTARATTWDLAAGSATFTGDVRLVRGDVTLRADRLEVQVAQQTSAAGGTSLRALVARGSVRVAQGARTARAGEAALDPATGMLVLRAGESGERPHLAEGASALEGAVVAIALDDARATCEGDAGGPCRLVLARAP